MIVYQLQDARHSIVAVRDMVFSDGDVPLTVQWLIDSQLLVFIEQLVKLELPYGLEDYVPFRRARWNQAQAAESLPQLLAALRAHRAHGSQTQSPETQL